MKRHLRLYRNSYIGMVVSVLFLGLLSIPFWAWDPPYRERGLETRVSELEHIISAQQSTIVLILENQRRLSERVFSEASTETCILSDSPITVTIKGRIYYGYPECEFSIFDRSR